MCAIPRPASRARDVHLYREVTERIRDADVDVVLNLTAGMGGDMVFGSPESRCRSTKRAPTWAAPPTAWSMCAECLPEICTLDCGTMNFAEATTS